MRLHKSEKAACAYVAIPDPGARYAADMAIRGMVRAYALGGDDVTKTVQQALIARTAPENPFVPRGRARLFVGVPPEAYQTSLG